MGYQLRFFYTQVAEARVLEMAQSLGLLIFPVPRATSQLALGFVEPPSRWIFGDEFIQFSRPIEKSLEGRIDFQPYKTDRSRKSPQICHAYEALSKAIKKHSYYSKTSEIWVFNDFQEQFEALQQEQTPHKAAAKKIREYTLRLPGVRNR